MSADELHDALAHECAHALRHDAVIALVQQIVTALYWLHPFIHILNRQLSRAREEVCDNVVLAGTPAPIYAHTLLALSQTIQSTRRRIAVVPMFDPRWRLAPRVAGILDTRRNTMSRTESRTGLLVVAVGLTLATPLAAVTTAEDRANEEQAKPAPVVGSDLSDAAKPSKSAESDPGIAEKPPVGIFAFLSLYLGNQQAKKTKLEDLRFDARKADLDVDEAKAQLDVNKYLFEKNHEANEKVPGAVSQKEIALDKANMDVAAIRVKQAQLSLERARTKLDRAMPALVVYTPKNHQSIRWPLDWINEGGMTTGNDSADFGPPVDASGHDVSLKSFLANLMLRLKHARRRLIDPPPVDPADLRIAIVRSKGSDQETVAAADDLKASDYVLGRDLLEGKTKDEVIHPGDVVVLFDAQARKSKSPEEGNTQPVRK
jgi:hypothetical protein